MPWIEWPWPRGKYQTSPGPKSTISERSSRIDGGDAAAAVDDIGPFGGIGVPVQLAEAAGVERHETPASVSETGNSTTVASLAVPPS